MKVALVASEVVPFAKTGGLADVAGALPPALERLGHEACVFLPKYRMVTESGVTTEPTGIGMDIPIAGRTVPVVIEKGTLPNSSVPAYFVVCDEFFDRPQLYGESGMDYPDNLDRFTLFCQSVLRFMKISGNKPDIIHCNDWQTALIPIYLKTVHSEDPFYQGIKTLYTIHNLAYQGVFSREQMPVTGLPWSLFSIDGVEFYGGLNLMKGALLFADHLSTVSEKYSEEIQTPEFGCRLDGVLRLRAEDLTGILNGVDYSEWSPETDKFIKKNYSVKDLAGKAACKADLQKEVGLDKEPKKPLIGVISRLADQKGFDILGEMVDYMLGLDVQFVLLGTGNPNYHRLFSEFGDRYPGKVAILLKYDNKMAHKIEAGSDLFLMPSRYEPCGLNQMYSLRYGTIPVVRETGGLADTIKEYVPKSKDGNGFVFAQPDPKALYFAIKRAVDTYKSRSWPTLVKRAMKMDFSWDVSAGKYEHLYQEMLRK